MHAFFSSEINHLALNLTIHEIQIRKTINVTDLVFPVAGIQEFDQRNCFFKNCCFLSKYCSMCGK